jgi:hypothetical protein
MSSELRFGGNVPFRDPRTGQSIDVRVSGAFVGDGVEPHEEQKLQEYILHMLRESAAAYDGDPHELPQQAGEWGQYVSMQLAPKIAQAFNAHGEVRIHSVNIAGASNASMGSPGMASAGMGSPGMMGTSAQKPMGMSAGGVDDLLANAFVQRLGVEASLAVKAVTVAIEVLAAHGLLAGKEPPKQPGYDAYGKQPSYDAYGSQPAFDKGTPDWDQKTEWDKKSDWKK